MADYISLSLSTPTSSNLQLQPIEAGYNDPACYMKVWSPSSFSLKASEAISVLIIPSDDAITPTEASGFLVDKTKVSDPSRGLYIYRFTNELDDSRTLTDLYTFQILNRPFENVKYKLFWLQQHVTDIIFDSDLAGVYLYPHNLQVQEVGFRAEVVDNNTMMRYTMSFPEVNNSGSVDYGVGNQPYLFSINYVYGQGDVTGVFSSGPIVFSDRYDYTEFSAGEPSANIVFDVPYHDPRSGFKEVPAQYRFNIRYNCADPVATGSIPLSVVMNHQTIEDQQMVDLDAWISTHLDDAKLRKIDDVYVERGVIDRSRLSIGVKDIVVKQNTYKKSGTYISKPYSSDFGIYTFSLRVDEFIPDYPNMNKYDTVNYFVEFNSRPWVRISPINRSLELDENGDAVPKLFVFDSDRGQTSENVGFLNYQAPVTVFRLKIVFDVTKVSDAFFIPPEIRDYECIVYDKNQMLEI